MTATVVGIARQQAEDFEANLAAFVRSHCDIEASGLNDGGAVVFIGRDLDFAALRAGFDACRA